MKVRIFPKKETLLGSLGSKLKEVQGDLDQYTGRMKELEEKMADNRFYNPLNEHEIAQLKSKITIAEQLETSLHDRIGLIESHEPPECMVELDL